MQYFATGASPRSGRSAAAILSLITTACQLIICRRWSAVSAADPSQVERFIWLCSSFADEAATHAGPQGRSNPSIAASAGPKDRCNVSLNVMSRFRKERPAEDTCYAWPADAAIQCECGAAALRGWIALAEELSELESVSSATDVVRGWAAFAGATLIRRQEPAYVSATDSQVSRWRVALKAGDPVSRSGRRNLAAV
jgi:hypothetical protein